MLILHLSDLHFGPHSRFAGESPEEVGKAFCRALTQAKGDAGCDGPIDLVCVTGDLTEAALPAQLELARRFLETVAGEAEIPRHRFILVPGNHDVYWIACKRVMLDQEEQDFPKEELPKRFNDVKLEGYLALVRSFRQAPEGVPLGRHGYLFAFPELRLSVAALSSCDRESHRDQDHLGVLGKDQARDLIEHWLHGEAAGWLKVACIHHNPVAPPTPVTDDIRNHLQQNGGLQPDDVDRFASDLAGFEGHERLREIAAQCGVQLVLHGHQHAHGIEVWPWSKGQGYAHVVAAGAWGLQQKKIPAEVPASARLIVLDPQERFIRVRTLTYLSWAQIAGSVDRGGFRVDPEAYEKPLELPAAWQGKTALVPAAYDPTSQDEIGRYCQKAVNLHSTLQLAGFPTRLRVPLDLQELYVPLRAMLDLRAVGDAYFGDASEAEVKLRDTGSLEIPVLDAFREAARRRRSGLVILGDPGSGKTTHLKRLLLWCLSEGATSLGLGEQMLPVFLPLRELHDLDRGLDAFIESQVEGPHLTVAPGFGKRLLARGRLLLLFDGLDEVADEQERLRVSRWIEEALRNHPGCFPVVTCRFAGYSPHVRLSERFLELHLRPLTWEQVERFVHGWYRIVETGLAADPQQGEVTAKRRADELLELLAGPDFRARRVFELTRNPLLLANLCLVHRDRGRLPRRRARLYEECIEVLLERWRDAKHLQVRMPAEESRRVLQPLALWLHEEEGRTRATAEEIAPVIEPALRSVKQQRDCSAAEFLRFIRDESGLLTGWSGDQFGFMHLGFQEYLAAREIRSRSFSDPAVLCELAQRFGDSWWQEVYLLLLALEEPSLFEPFMREVVQLPAFAEHRDLVDACLDDAIEVSDRPFIELVEAAPGKDQGLWERQLQALRVLDSRASPALARLREALREHPSSDVRRWLGFQEVRVTAEVIRPEPSGYELVLIPGGTFLMGSPKSEEGQWGGEGPQHEVTISSFYMGRYPVTNEEYSRFLAGNPGIKEPEYWGNRKFNQPRQPVVGVSWEEAQRYAAWAGLRLPSEAEWEYACRAGTTTRYYSGDTEKDLARVGWYHKNAGEKTMPVGEKEPNDLGLYDMHGNVWEWCQDWEGEYSAEPQVDPTGPERGDHRVLRGGSWIDSAWDCRSAIRNAYLPGDQYDVFIGFRLARGQEE